MSISECANAFRVRFAPVLLAWVVAGVGTGCGTLTGGRSPEAALRRSVTFHASFDRGTDADLALGDPWFYQAPAMDRIKEARPGLPSGGPVTLAPREGKYGGALHFSKATGSILFFRGASNVTWSAKDWSGTISFWLRAGPDELAEGYCDPLQVTTKAWNDAAFFVEFERRPAGVPFRLGAYADYRVWNPNDRKWEDIPAGEKPLITVPGPPFTRDRWTHVAFTWRRFNTGQPDGVASLYLDGALIGTIGERRQTFTWNPADLRLMLGVGYVGWIDEVAVFDRALGAEEIQRVRRLPHGIRSLFDR